ncbi:phage integrase N-terminal SAM-like domain-containing protein [Marinobacterium lacunae]|nr:phage integrase N-terminal SAM-like domain-containing protein [Marinobacterium lacunae]
MARSPFLRLVEDFMRVQRYSRRTIDSYLYWVKLFILVCSKRHPSDFGDDETKRFLTYLATE